MVDNKPYTMIINIAMRRIFFIIYGMLTMAMRLCAQTCDLPISIAFENDETAQLPASVRQQIVSKMKQLLTANGVAGDIRYSQFVLIPHVNTVDKHVVAGPPAKVVMTLNVNLDIRDTSEGTVMSTYSTDVNAVGNSETMTLMQGVRQIASGNSDVKAFVETARSKIVDYYDRNSKNIMKKAQTLAGTDHYDEALYHLMSVPECCVSYDEVSEMAMTIYQLRADREGQKLLTEAQAIWAAGNDEDAAVRAAELLSQIDPDAVCYNKALQLLGEIQKKSSTKAVWNVEMKKFDAEVDIRKRKIDAAKAIGVAYGNGQQPQTTNLVFAQ